MSRRPTDLRYDDGRTASWEAIRRHVLAEEPSCRRCGQPSVEVDHIWPRYFGGTDHRSNLQGLCVTCNRTKGNAVDRENASSDLLGRGAVASIVRMLSAKDEMQSFVNLLAARALYTDPKAADVLEWPDVSDLLDHCIRSATTTLDLITEIRGVGAAVDGLSGHGRPPASPTPESMGVSGSREARSVAGSSEPRDRSRTPSFASPCPAQAGTPADTRPVERVSANHAEEER